jgi:hypothetical protein
MSSECSTGLDPEGVIRQLSTRSLEHDCLEGNSHGIGAEFARYCFSKGLDDPFRIDAAPRSYLIDQRVAEHKRLGIGRGIGDRLIQAQYLDPEVSKASSSQRILDRIDSVVAERHSIKLWRVVREKPREDRSDQATVSGCDGPSPKR